MKILTTITTYNRPKLCARLVSQVLREAKAAGVDVELVIADDASRPSYVNRVARLMKGESIRCHIVRYDRNHGKENFWILQTDLYQEVKKREWDYVVMLQDDVQLKGGFYTKAVKAFESITDRNKACLNLYRDHRSSEWGSGEPVDMRFGEVAVQLVNWTDLPAMICNRRFFQKLEWHVEPVYRDWQRNPEYGSGVGAQISRRLRANQATIWRLSKSLVKDTGEHKSQMNPNRTHLIKSL